MKSKIIVILTAFCTILISSIAIVSADPSNPPPPPPVTSYTYILMDEFKGCGPQDGEANFCEDYYLRQKVVSSQSGTTQSETYVCGKDSRCDVNTPCIINITNDNSGWKNISLDEGWKCPDGYGIAQLHEPGNLEPQYDTLSFSGSSIISNEIVFRSNNSLNLFFNSYIPACVNRIPMMNFNAYLENSTNGKQSTKTGIYALHETLDYDANPTGGELKSFDIPQQKLFRKVYDMKGDLRTYRMWSFRERFTEGLMRTVNQENLELPENINVDSLDGTRSHDFDEIYFSADFMKGKFDAENLGGYPVGTDITQSNSLRCNIDVNDMGINGITDNDDFENKHEQNSFQNQIVNSIANNGLCDSLDSSMTLNSVDFMSKLSSVDTNEYSDTIEIVDIYNIGLSSNYDNLDEFENWASSNYVELSNKLKNKGILDNDKSISSITSYDRDANNNDSIEFDAEIIESQDYDGFVEVELNVEYEVSTSSTWNWRSLEDLTLTLLAKCLYNWNECLFNEREQSGISWTMNEVADLGYGPDMDSVAYQWSVQELMNDYGLTYGFHFDGARGFNSNTIPITVFRTCETGDEWISKEGYYSCYEENIYKCGFGLSADEDEIGVIPVVIGNTINTSGGTGYVCHNANISGILEPRWSPITCPTP